MKIRSAILSITLMALTVGVGLVSPALAATNTFESRTQNLTLGPFPTAFVMCGSTVTSLTFHSREFSLVLWDNGRVEMTFKNTFVEFDSGGARVAQVQFENIVIAGEGGLPFVFEENIIATCSGASGTPGLDAQLIFGSTIGEDGTVKEVHAHA